MAGPDRWDRAQVVVQTIGSKPNDRKVLLSGGSDARYLATGHIVYAFSGSMLAVPFDEDRLEVRGGPVPIVEGVARTATPMTRGGYAQYAISDNGVLAYAPGTATGTAEPKVLALVDRMGSVQRLDVPPQSYVHPRLSPDGKHFAVATDGAKEAGVWIGELAPHGTLRRLTLTGRSLFPIWSPDGRYVAYQSDREGDRAIFKQLADGSGVPERLTKPASGASHEPESWSPDGRTISFDMVQGPNQGVWTVALEGDRTPKVFVDTPTVEKHSAFSPNGKWLAYMSTSDFGIANTEVFVQPFPPTGSVYQISPDVGRTPAWSHDGKQLFFHQSTTNRLFAVDVRADQAFSFGKPEPLPIEGTIHPQMQRNYDVTADGQRFLLVLPATGGPEGGRRFTPQLSVVLHWFEELKQRVPVK